MSRQPYCYKRYFELDYAMSQSKGEARHWLKMHFGSEGADYALSDIEQGKIVTTNAAWYGQDKAEVEALAAEEPGAA